MAIAVRPALAFAPGFALESADGRPVLRATLEVMSAVVFMPHFRVRIDSAAAVLESDSRDTCYLGWLPRGKYRVDIVLPDALPAGPGRVQAEARHRHGFEDVTAGATEASFTAPAPGTRSVASIAWTIESIAPTPPLAELSWRKGHTDWFFRHFDHAASVVIGYILADSPLLRERVLDVGCGDGITDLSIAMRTGCRELVGIDPFRGYERLPDIIARNHLPSDAVPGNLRFMDADANSLPFPDDRFDVVLSWGSLEHIAGGYAQALAEIRRVLRPGGLFFVHPGLYYSNFGHHLGEFCDEPFFHLKKPLEEIRRIVLENPPRYMDRSGEFSTPAQYWQWFRELNPITVTGFEQELRALDFEPWRVAIRTEGVIEYTPEILRYPMQDLATTELYMSCVNRKPGSGAG
jgi:ubiquinone/menaquinone biosynthesis C-methylase UbiE